MNWLKKKYIINPLEEEKIFRHAYLDFIDKRDNDEIQIFYVPNYSCNFVCAYCYQSEYTISKSNYNSNEVIDAFFNFINVKFVNRGKYITLFGGEPLLKTSSQQKTIEYFIKQANKYGLEVSLVTNGYWLEEFLPLLNQSKIREIQVTLDGTKEIHNNRRYLKDKKETFDKIVKGIDLCLQNQFNINLRVVVDKENIDNLPKLAEFAIKKGWTQNPHFKTQIGRNYELHYCQSAFNKLFTRIELYEKLYKLILQYPSILEFHKPAFSITKFIWENKSIPESLFDSCPACKTEWAFDYTGNIYSCTATVGKPGEELGTFYPKIVTDDLKILEWETRDITAIDKCKNCNVQLACGGGCAAVAKNINGSIHSPDCRPISSLLELGFSMYFEKFEKKI